MKKFFIDPSAISAHQIIIGGDQHIHLAKVLRTQIAEQIICLAGTQDEYLCEVADIDKKFTTARIVETRPCLGNPKFNITIFQGLAKGEKLDFITQKLTELGATTLALFESNFTIAKNTHPKTERLTKISQEACKQCGRSIPLELPEPIKLKNIAALLKNFDLVLFFYEKAPPEATLESLIPEIKSAKNIAVIIGSEGGFSDEENALLLSLGARATTLGTRILRTETAAIATTSFISFIKNN